MMTENRLNLYVVYTTVEAVLVVSNKPLKPPLIFGFSGALQLRVTGVLMEFQIGFT
jgi:hypothetical protein